MICRLQGPNESVVVVASASAIDLRIWNNFLKGLEASIPVFTHFRKP